MSTVSATVMDADTRRYYQTASRMNAFDASDGSPTVSEDGNTIRE